jgi:hypothetical protein
VSEAEHWTAAARPAPPVLAFVAEPPPERLTALPAAVEGDGGYAFTHTQPYDTTRPVAFDPCRPVRWAVRRAGEIPGGDALLDEAAAEVARLTGLRLERVADTHEPPSADRPLAQHARYGAGAAPVLVVWSDEREWPALSGLVAGIAGAHWLETGRVDSRRYLTGQLVLDAEQLRSTLEASPSGSARVRAVLLHELAHVVGLDHVDAPGQLMAPYHVDQREFGDGDRRGLRALGDGECFSDWDLVVGDAPG